MQHWTQGNQNVIYIKNRKLIIIATLDQRCSYYWFQLSDWCNCCTKCADYRVTLELWVVSKLQILQIFEFLKIVWICIVVWIWILGFGFKFIKKVIPNPSPNPKPPKIKMDSKSKSILKLKSKSKSKSTKNKDGFQIQIHF